MKSFTLILFVIVLSACGMPQRIPGQAELRDVIKLANRQLMDAYNRGDKLAVARMYEDNAVMISDRGERYQGREAIDAYWNPPPKPGAAAPKPGAWSLEVLSVEGNPNMLIQRGRSILKSEWDGKASTSDVQFVVVWRRQSDNSYKIAVDAWWPTQQ